MPKAIGRSLPVSTPFTPASPAAGEESMETMRAWAWGLRSSFAYSIRGRNRSSANFVAPVTLAVASTLRSALPTTRSSASLIQRLRHRLVALAAHASRRQLDRLVALDVAGAQVQVAGP